jgi:hypothetical protein
MYPIEAYKLEHLRYILLEFFRGELETVKRPRVSAAGVSC